MQLKYNNFIKNKVIYMDLETVNFSSREEAALSKFGEPVIVLHKTYGKKDDFVVSIERRIKTGFKIRVKFDGSEDLQDATSSANQFFEEIELKLEEAMGDLMEKFADLEVDFKTETGFKDILY